MNETYNLKAIIIKRAAFREADLKVTLYSPEKGKLELIARGAKKTKSKMAGHLEPFCFSEIMVISGRQLEYIGAAVNIFSFCRLKDDLEKLAWAGKAFKIFDKLVKENEPDEKVFSLLLEFLNVLDKGKKIQLKLVFNLFIFKLLNEMGYQPELYCCLACQKRVLPRGNRIDFNYGGLICPKCRISSKDAKAISEDCIKLFRLASQKKLNDLPAVKINTKLEAELAAGISSFLETF